MFFSTAALVLATLAFDSAVAGPLRRGHEHFHAKKTAEPTALEVYVRVAIAPVPRTDIVTATWKSAPQVMLRLTLVPCTNIK